MNAAAFVLGVIVLAVVVVDLLWTTLWVEGGAGPLTSRLMSGTWETTRRIGNQYPSVRTLTGPLILLAGFSMWIVLLWAGWTLVFASVERTIVHTASSAPPSWIDTVYFVGYAIFTLGNGDFAPSGGVWQLATTLTAATGMLFITLSVTYLLSVLDAVTQKRSFASGVNGLGTRGVDVLQRSWDGEEFRGLEVPLGTLAMQLNTLSANHKAYPIIHYFHSAEAEEAPVTSIAILDDALTLFRFGVAERARPGETVLMNAHSSVRQYLGTVRGRFIEPATQRPPTPRLESLRESGIPTVSDEQFATSLSDVDERRRTLRGLVESDDRRWPSSVGRDAESKGQ